MASVGFIGLGNMGSVLAANLVTMGHAVVTHDVTGPDRSPEGARFVHSLDDVARETEIVVCSLPDGAVSELVAKGLKAAAGRNTRVVIDTSTIGVSAAQVVDRLLTAAGIGYVDAPVSGGVAGARARTLSVMYAGAEEACTEAEPVLEGLSDRRRLVGNRPGMAQALKLANNFLSATTLAATSEALALGLSMGLDLTTMIEVLNASSGQSAATSDKFPTQVLTGRYAAGFTNSLMTKDLRLFLDAVETEGSPSVLGPTTAAVWEEFAAAEPGADFTRIFPFVEGS